jgi:hypothetical protein
MLRLLSTVIMIGAAGLASQTFAGTELGFRLSVVSNHSGTEQELRAWTYLELGRLKGAQRKEKDPATGKIYQWKGILLSEVVEQALAAIPVEHKALIDLVVLKGTAGRQALISRAFLMKYPILLALSRDGQTLKQQGPIYSVAPWTSNPRIVQEGVPLENLFVPGVTQVELSNYREKFGAYFLKRRTDPAAVRGEKLFFQNCMSCHALGQGPGISELFSLDRNRKFVLSDHLDVKGLPQTGERDKRFLANYLEAYRAERPDSSQ